MKLRSVTTTSYFLSSSLLLSHITNLHFVTCDWIDPDTPASSLTTHPLHIDKYHELHPLDSDADTDYNKLNLDNTEDEDTYVLVMSDEFNVPGRNFSDGQDPMWTAVNKNDYTNGALQYYSHEEVGTNTYGELEITTRLQETVLVGYDDATRKNTQEIKRFRSGLMQSWNKFCLTGGIVEAKVLLPGKSWVSGLWPAMWLLGNLSRNTFTGSTDHVWPFSNPNSCPRKQQTQSSSNTNNDIEQCQRINGCLSSVHYGMHPNEGRGAPEIDILETQAGYQGRPNMVGQPFLSASYQLAPGWGPQRPKQGVPPPRWNWYRGLWYGTDDKTSLNIDFYGDLVSFPNAPWAKDYWRDAISFNYQLDQSHYENTSNEGHVVRLEWEVPDKKTGEKGHLRWFMDGKFMWGMNGETLEAANMGTEISSEPSYLILNTAVSKNWGFTGCWGTNCPCEEFDCNSWDWTKKCGFPPGFCDMMNENPPPKYKVDWIRVYQNPNKKKQKVGCSTPERPTKKYIEAFAEIYKSASDDAPLKPIQVGKGDCTTNNNDEDKPFSCGGNNRGECVDKKCRCLNGWIGSHCRAHDGYDDIDWSAIERALSFHGPSWYILLASLVMGVIWVLLVVVNARSIESKKGYMEVPQLTTANRTRPIL